MKVLVSMLLVATLAACGEKLPESKAAKEVGNIPKQTLDKAQSGVEKGLQQGADRTKEEDKKQ
jgi:predicted small lipoprotein YifL